MGGNDSTSSSKPLTGPEREEAFKYGTSSIADLLANSGYFSSVGGRPAQGEEKIWVPGKPGHTINGIGNIGGTEGHWIDNPNYIPATKGTLALNQDKLGYTAPEYQSLNGGDYAALEKNIIASRTAPLDTAWLKARQDINNEAGGRGIWSSNLPVDKMQRFYAENFLPAYQQAGADAAVQRYAMEQQDLTARNAAAMENAQRKYDATWRPLDYGQGLYNQTGGVVSTGNSSGWSI